MRSTSWASTCGSTRRRADKGKTSQGHEDARTSSEGFRVSGRARGNARGDAGARGFERGTRASARERHVGRSQLAIRPSKRAAATPRPRRFTARRRGSGPAAQRHGARRAMTSSSRRPRAPGERASGMRDARITRSVTDRTSSPPNHARDVLARARRRARRRASRTEKPSDPRRGRPPREKARHRGAALGARRARGWDRGRRRAVRLDEPGHAPW